MKLKEYFGMLAAAFIGLMKKLEKLFGRTRFIMLLLVILLLNLLFIIDLIPEPKYERKDDSSSSTPDAAVTIESTPLPDNSVSDSSADESGSDHENALKPLKTQVVEALAGFPGLYRVVTIDAQKNEMTIHSQKVEGFDDEFSDQFFGMIRRVINAAADDIDDFAQKAEAFSVKKKFTYRYGWMIKPLAKLIRKIRISTVCRLCRKESGLTKEEIKALKDSKVMDLVIDMAMNLYKGDGRFYPDTAEYKAAMGFAAVIDSFLETIKMPIGKFLKGIDSVCDVFEPLLYKKGIPDGDAVLPINADKTFAESLYPSAQRIKSKKGAGILIILILIVLILLPFVPLIAVLFGISALINYIKFYKKIKELN